MSEQERRRINIGQLHDQLKAAVQAIETGDQWRNWLDFAGKLNRYSFDNLMLIMRQRPDATAVASYTTWKSIDRQVQWGERSIKVLAPVTRRIDVTDDRGQPVLDEDGHRRRRNKIIGYRPVSVFDIKQTTGAPLPEPARPTLLVGQAPDGLWASLEREVSERGYRLLRAGSERLGSANGATMPGPREVWVRDDVDDAQAVKTLAHELARIILHADDPDAPCRGIKEVEAESVAYLTLASHGMTTDNYSFPYVTHWAYPIAEVEHVDMAEIVTRTGRRVIDAARTILEATQTARAPDAALAAIAVRTQAAAEHTKTLREEVEAKALPPVERAVLLGVVADSDAYFRSQVQRSWVPEYLAGRGLGTAVDGHGIGYAPNGWTELTDHLRSLGYTDDHIEASGMATRARTGNLIDRFRDRMTLPLRDAAGDLVGFTARSGPDSDGEIPKYLNSPSTVIFKKSELMYGLGEHRQAIGLDSVPVICEGPLDAIAVDLVALRSGTDLVGLATCGTAFTVAHAGELGKTRAAEVCLAYDGDEAGNKAVERAWTKITDVGIKRVTIAELPAGTDPASLAVENPAELVRMVAAARSAAYVFADRRIDVAPIGDNVPRAYALFHDLVDWAQRLPAEERVGLAVHMARRLDIDPTDAAAEITERHPGFMTDASDASVRDHCVALREQIAYAEVDHDFTPQVERRTAQISIGK
ncbi:toprim domain-containing protein [Microlunatus sp. Gsoil 973]|uniref:toprim domain-containing protein n=1 Tax=Microlunatus sp. Gsoil 973 TaxID=2672569 RepID=UPI0012B45CC3|nr:toprim domain-containing protein [Microlunatus sp. Gsoil 973]QGN34494.1 toprim domain-containing protein [Microlunatus sp. Gsoil 973]